MEKKYYTSKEEIINAMKAMGHFKGNYPKQWLLEDIDDQEVEEIFAKMYPISDAIIKSRGE